MYVQAIFKIVILYLSQINALIITANYSITWNLSADTTGMIGTANHNVRYLLLFDELLHAVKDSANMV